MYPFESGEPSKYNAFLYRSFCHKGHGFLKFSLILYNSDEKVCEKVALFYDKLSLLIRSIVLSLHSSDFLTFSPLYYMGQ